MKVFINIVVYQACWFACIIGAAQGYPLTGIAAAGLAVAWHLYSADRPGPEAVLILIAAVIGGTWDSLLVAAGWLVYPNGMLIEGTAPYWIVALWVGFATTFNVSLRWFKQHLVLAALFGAVGGPLAFLAGERLGGVVFASYAGGITALAIGWALLLPLMLIISNRWNGFDRAEAPTGVAAATD